MFLTAKAAADVLAQTFRILHQAGATLLVGNLVVMPVWKVAADRSRDPRVARFAQRLVTLTTWFISAPAILLILGSGFGSSLAAGLPPFADGWLRLGEILFACFGLVWLLLLVPLQIRQGRLARSLAEGRAIPEPYRRLGRRWLAWLLVSLMPLLGAYAAMLGRAPIH